MNRALRFAIQAHGDQQYGDQPYVFHLEQTLGVLEYLGLADDLVLCDAAVLHDVLEDTAVKYEQLRNIFGPRVANLVYAVTDELGRDRQERKAKTYPKIAADRDAITIKLCDRIANVEHCLRTGEAEKLAMYKKEQPMFELYLEPAGGDPAAWLYLGHLLKDGPSALRQGASLEALP